MMRARSVDIIHFGRGQSSSSFVMYCHVRLAQPLNLCLNNLWVFCWCVHWLRLHFKFRLCTASLVRFNFQLRFYRQNEGIIADNRFLLLLRKKHSERDRERKKKQMIFINTRNFEAICSWTNWTGSFKSNVNIIAHSTKINLAAQMDIAQKYR